ncbi:division abnormally delayed protein [Achroia grisella]|uniref:division abnormally delayed protein n=1 Tax=Achroia grisella TaxID=688607 RepID=UPI0027D3416A|nr:division abnormally delayed protein [Achroia grisella]
MKCYIVVLMVLACGSAASAAAASSCSGSEGFFARYNASADDSNQPGSICGGQCCGRGREQQLRAALMRVAVEQAAMKTRPITDLLLSTRRTLQEHLIALSHQSQNKTAGLLTQLYREHASRAHAPLAVLYDDIRTVLRTPENNTSREHATDVSDSTRKFFVELFPVAYQNVLKLESKQFTTSYEDCLKSAYNAVAPFGDVPKKMGKSLSHSLKAARALLEALAAGAGVLAASEHVLSTTGGSECANHLLIAGGCAYCKGFDVRPCRNFCINVARGCITSLLAELDAPWAGYVEGMERLDRADADVDIREIEGKISEAIMYAIENKGTLESKVHKECGVTMTMEASSLTSPLPSPGATRRNALNAPPPDAILLDFAASLSRKKKLFAHLGDYLCDELDFAQDGDDNCWNGKSIGDYTKPLVSSSLIDQKYNPEVLDIPRDPRVAALGDKLQQARQLLVRTTIGSDINSPDVFMQGDEASEEGSGNYRSYDDDASYDTEGSGEEGSGMHETGNRQYEGVETPYTTTPETAAAGTPRPLLSIVFNLAMFTGLRHCLT